METRQAYFRNMRSKCRCSCVLQFTRHHRVSSVLHRPPSQMIHCIVLCFLILGPKVQRVCKRVNTPRREEGLGYRNPTWGDQNLFRGGSSLNCSIDIPQTRLASKVAERGTVPQTGPSRLEADSKIETSGRRRLSKRRRARAPRRQTLFQSLDFPSVFGLFASPCGDRQPIMILPQVHLRKPCYDFYFL